MTSRPAQARSPGEQGDGGSLQPQAASVPTEGHDAVVLDSVERMIVAERVRLPDVGPEVIARHLYTSLAAHPDTPNALWLIQGLKSVIGRERTENSRIMSDFRDAAPGAAAVAEHDAFLRANPHLNEADPNVRR